MFIKFSSVKESDILEWNLKTNLAHEKLLNDNLYNGWLNLASKYTSDELNKIKNAAQKIKSKSNVFVVIGIGGSYLGARAAIEFLKSQNYNLYSKTNPKIIFIGNSMSSSDLSSTLEYCKDKDISINVISKSGSTLEPAMAFRFFEKFIHEKYGNDEAKNRIYCTTDTQKGILREIAIQNSYEIFGIPENIGGRYSVLTAVGLLPMAVASIDIDKIIEGAKDAEIKYSSKELSSNDCYKYAVIRNYLYNKGYQVELIASYEPRLRSFCEWFKQLFAESEGKNHKGIFPASALFSTDLHSLGQYIQDGRRMLFETIINFENPINDMNIPHDTENLDNLNFLENKSIDYINKQAYKATLAAHTESGVPNTVITADKMDEFNLGSLIYFFQKACAISAYLLGVNPFDQPGVECYKQKMFTLLEKPGYNIKR